MRLAYSWASCAAANPAKCCRSKYMIMSIENSWSTSLSENTSPDSKSCTIAVYRDRNRKNEYITYYVLI